MGPRLLTAFGTDRERFEHSMEISVWVTGSYGGKAARAAHRVHASSLPPPRTPKKRVLKDSLTTGYQPASGSRRPFVSLHLT